MISKTDPPKRGRKPTGRVTKSTTMRLRSDIKERLKLASSTGAGTQTSLVEEALDKELPPLP